MKIGIMSMQRVSNYGSSMQALSLKRMLESLGNEVVFVDYKAEIRVQHRNFKMKLKHKFVTLKKSAKHIIKKCLWINRTSALDQVFYDFYNVLGITEKKTYRTKVDMLVIGSDEVFNCLQDSDAVGFSMELFGKNNQAKRLISYAASFGNTTYDRLKAFQVEATVAKHLSDFDAISVRDRNSAEVVRLLTGKDPALHMDPVFVGDLEDLPWKEVKEQDYIIVYGYSNRFTDEEKVAIRDFAKNVGLKTISLYGTQDFCDISITPGVDEIISYFRNAKYVITETFHGTLFSVITHRPFVTIVRKTVNNSYGNEEKLNDLLERIGVLDRKITDLNSLEETMHRPIDYDRIDALRLLEREKTLEYLKQQLDGIRG